MASKLKNVRDFKSLVEYFTNELNWPLDIEYIDDVNDIAFDYEPDELGLSKEYAAKIKSIKQLRPLSDKQPWGIFYIEFERKQIPVLALRKILSQLIPTKRTRANDHAVWNKQDLLFICFFGDFDRRAIGFAHFSDNKGTLPTLKTFHFEPDKETNFNFEEDLKRLSWPRDENDVNMWKIQWGSAFTRRHKQVITDSKTLSLRLAQLAINTRHLIIQIFNIESSKGYLHELFKKFKSMLIHDLSIEQFADMYAQTVAYGLFSARCMDKDGHFELSEVIERIPNTNPFLKEIMRKCFYHGANKEVTFSFDELEINEIIELLDNTDTDEILKDFNRQTGDGKEDPVIYFYEGFLTEYEHQEKKRRGVYYTPQPVVDFMVRAVDYILKSEFGFEDGLAETSKKPIKIIRDSKRKRDGWYKYKVEDVIEVPAVQILDPATGTGTFLRQVILQIKDNFDEKHKGMNSSDIRKLWNEYVPKYLLPRIFGFELMMAPYAVAHMKLALVLKETGYDFKNGGRINVLLANSLEEPGATEMTILDDPLSQESYAANEVKSNSGINIVIGNPPYNVSSANSGGWISKILNDYKEGLNERKINLDDDYIKFIRYAQHIVEKSRTGILAYITNNSFISGVTHRKMREILLKVFDEIYIIDLHGNSKIKEISPDGSPDENVFDIQQGVSINILIRSTNSREKSAKVYHCDIFGLREKKYKMLLNNSIQTIKWNQILPEEPYYFFTNKKYKDDNYEKGFCVNDLFVNKNTGIQTKNDNLTIQYTKEEIEKIVKDFINNTEEDLKEIYGIKEGTWTVEAAKSDLQSNDFSIEPILFKPFDVRYTALTKKSGGFLGRPRYSTMRHMISISNLALLVGRQNKSNSIDSFLITKYVSEMKCAERTIQSYHMPLYVCNEEGHKIVNFNYNIINTIEASLSLKFRDDKIMKNEYFTPVNLLDYIYAILYSPSYRSRYRELLKIDFPRIPYPRDPKQFWEYVYLGEQLRHLHLMEYDLKDIDLGEYVRKGTNIVEKILYEYPRVYINSETYFDNVSNEAWSLGIGGYQPLQKWLKDRNGMTLNEEDIKHYQKMIYIMSETIKIMDAIDEVHIF